MMALAMVAASSCGSELVRSGRSPAFLIVESVTAASGADGGTKFGGSLGSDVLTFVKKTINGVPTLVPTVFSDNGQVELSLGLKNPGTFDATGALTPAAPSSLNSITITRYHVRFLRADGRNREGIDVPYGFDGGLTGTVGSSGATLRFELVRHVSKEEPPLINLIFTPGQPGLDINGAGLISTIAEITFYGRDQVGNEVSAVGTISVIFGDFGDPV
jgi:hypothetical protein